MSVNIVKQDGSLQRIAGGTLYADAPIGTISPFGGSVIPNGYLLCDGTEVLKTTYAELYAVIGDAFGTASDNTKFKLPDLRGEFLRGAGTNSHSGQGNGGTVGQHQNATVIPEIEAYQGNTSTPTTIISSGTSGTSAKSIMNGDSKIVVQNMWINKITGTKDSGNTDFDSYWAMRTVRPTNTSVNYIIKAKQVAVPFDMAEYVKDFIISKFVQIDVPAQSGVGEYTVTKTLTIPEGYKFLAFGSVSCVHYNQVLMSATFNNTTNVASIRIYNDYGVISALANAVKAWVLYVKA